MEKRIFLQQILQLLEFHQRVIVKEGEDIIYDGKAIGARSTPLAWDYLVHNLTYEPINDIYYIGVEPMEV